jgi:threonine dehydrogenase-like Zn-dependent dehydrogenase
MRAITVQPGAAGSARLDEWPEPAVSEGALMVRARLLGVCGTDAEIVAGLFGTAPEGADRLIIGHESLGEVLEAPAASGFSRGDLVVGIVRRPDPVPCLSCGAGEWDMCRNGRYTERGIKERHGFGAERFRLEPEFAVKVDAGLGELGVLLEPASIVAKAWDHIERIGQRSRAWKPRTLIVSGAGPIGLLAALLGAQRGLAVHVLDRNPDGPKPDLVQRLGGRYHVDATSLRNIAADIWIECTAAPALMVTALTATAPDGILCLAGVSSPGHTAAIDIGALGRDLVLGNRVIFGSVNANRSHYDAAAAALVRADRDWLASLITRRVPLARFADALVRQPDDVKVVIDFNG